VEAGSNTSTVTLRIVGGDEEGNLKSETAKYGLKSQVPRDSDPRKTALARASSTYKRQTRPLVREGAPQEQDRNRHTINKYLVISDFQYFYNKTYLNLQNNLCKLVLKPVRAVSWLLRLGAGSSEQRLGNFYKTFVPGKASPEKIFLKVSSVLPC
jgi:hypothetical protein